MGDPYIVVEDLWLKEALVGAGQAAGEPKALTCTLSSTALLPGVAWKGQPLR